MSNELLFYCNVPILYGIDPDLNRLPGIEQYKMFAKYFDINASLADRTNAIKFPFKMQTSTIPTFDKNFNMTYRECASLRMKELDIQQQQTGKKFRLMYSGGVDSSGIFSAFVDYYGLDKTKDLLEICCSKESIDENPWLWDKYIRKNNFDIISSHDHGTQWHDDKMIIMGEGNDQLFGKSVDYAYYRSIGVHTEVTTEAIKKYLDKKNPHVDNSHNSALLFGLIDTAPFAITNMFTFLWWCSFALTWDGVSNRVLSQSSDSLPSDILHNGLIQFYITDKFQQWSMRYHYEFDPELIQQYRYVCKHMTIDILDIPEYVNKHKFRSFPKLHALRPTAYLIDTDLQLYRDTVDYLKFVQRDNSFI